MWRAAYSKDTEEFARVQEHQQADTDDGSRADATVMTVALPDQAVAEGWDCISCC